MTSKQECICAMSKGAAPPHAHWCPATGDPAYARQEADATTSNELCDLLLDAAVDEMNDLSRDLGAVIPHLLMKAREEIIKLRGSDEPKPIRTSLEDSWDAVLARTAEPPAEHPPQLMAVVDRWQDEVNAIRVSGDTHLALTLSELLSDIRRASQPPGDCNQCDELIGERDRAQDALQETHIALGGDGEWVGRSPPQPAPDSGDLHLDVPELARERMAELERLRASSPPAVPLPMLSDLYKVYEALRQVGELNWPFDKDHHAVLNMIDEKYGRQMGDLLDDDGEPLTKPGRPHRIDRLGDCVNPGCTYPSVGNWDKDNCSAAETGESRDG